MANKINGFLEDRASNIKAAGAASAGVSQYAAAADHVHPLPTGAVNWVTKPAAANSSGTAGDAAYESGYLYVCVAKDTWQRVAIATWT